MFAGKERYKLNTDPGGRMQFFLHHMDSQISIEIHIIASLVDCGEICGAKLDNLVNFGIDYTTIVLCVFPHKVLNQ